ncbi:MAG: TRAP transporter large permease subunit, partial [Gemmatimonadetes bacterium]|nr:TRAP transporter large permease subunit [Gemmatimonadota bacterium]
MSIWLVGLLLLLILVNVPIAVALALMTVVAIVASGGVEAIPNVGLVMFSGATKFPLIAIPLFILAGTIMNSSGISRRLVAFASALFGFIRGGLSMVSISASMF